MVPWGVIQSAFSARALWGINCGSTEADRERAALQRRHVRGRDWLLWWESSPLTGSHVAERGAAALMKQDRNCVCHLTDTPNTFLAARMSPLYVSTVLLLWQQSTGSNIFTHHGEFSIMVECGKSLQSPICHVLICEAAGKTRFFSKLRNILIILGRLTWPKTILFDILFIACLWIQTKVAQVMNLNHLFSFCQTISPWLCFSVLSQSDFSLNALSGSMTFARGL